MCLNCDNSYYAGLFDGEGHVMIRMANHRPPYLPSYELQVTIGNTVIEPLLRGQKKWSGRIYGRKPSNRNKIVYAWTLCGQKAARFIADIFQFSQIKNQQIALALEFQDRVDSYTGPRRRTDEERAERERLRQAIRSLNTRTYNGEYHDLPKIKPIGGGCLNCGCGDWSSNQGDPLNLTLSRLRLVALRNNSTVEEQVKNILATVLGYITKKEPLEYRENNIDYSDEIEVKIKRLKKEAPTKPHYVQRPNG